MTIKSIAKLEAQAKLDAQHLALQKSEIVNVTRAIVSPPSSTFLSGVSDSPEIQKIQKDKVQVHNKWLEITSQWEAYYEVLRANVEHVTIKPSNKENPDGHYVQDHAFVLNGHAIMSNPGSPYRAKETSQIKIELIKAGISPNNIFTPKQGKLEIGDVVPDFENKVIFVGITSLPPEKQRTNMDGVKEFAYFMKAVDPEFTVVGLKGNGSPHLGSAFTILGNGVAVVDPKANINFAEPYMPYPNKFFVLPYSKLWNIVDPNFQKVADVSSRKGLMMLERNEGYAANVLVANGHLIYPSGYENAEKIFHAQFGQENTTAIDLSASRQMNGSATCWHLPFFEIQRK